MRPAGPKEGLLQRGRQAGLPLQMRLRVARPLPLRRQVTESRLVLAVRLLLTLQRGTPERVETRRGSSSAELPVWPSRLLFLSRVSRARRRRQLS